MKQITTSLAAVLSLLTLAQAASAQYTPGPNFTKDEQDLSRTNPNYFKINPASVKLTLIETAEEPDMSYVKLQEDPRVGLTDIPVLGNIINVAQKIWNIVEANKPVVNIDTKYATAYPYGITSASQLSSWKKPKTYTYGFYAENLYGMTMIDVKYKVTYSYGGAYKGKGKFLTGVTVIPTNVTVGWGYKFYMSASVPDSTVTNVATTSEDPTAAMQLILKWKMSTILKDSEGTSVYYIQGDGLFQQTASPFKKEVKLEDMKSAAPLLLSPEKVF